MRRALLAVAALVCAGLAVLTWVSPGRSAAPVPDGRALQVAGGELRLAPYQFAWIRG